MRFSPLLPHQLTKLPHLPADSALVMSLVAARKVLIAASESLYPGGNPAQLPHSQPEGQQVGVVERALVGETM